MRFTLGNRRLDERSKRMQAHGLCRIQFQFGTLGENYTMAPARSGLATSGGLTLPRTASIKIAATISAARPNTVFTW
jgi:hypothetical protein